MRSHLQQRLELSLDGETPARKGGLVGGLSTLLATGILPLPAWVLLVREAPHASAAWWTGGVVLCALVALAILGAALGHQFAPSLSNISWWGFFPLALVPGVVMSFMSGLGLVFGAILVSWGNPAVRGWNGAAGLPEALSSAFLLGGSGLFVGLPWGLGTSLIIRFCGRGH